MSHTLYYVRNPAVVAVARHDAYYFLRPGASPVVLQPVDTEAMSELLARTATPLAAASLEDLIDVDTRDVLLDAGIVLRVTADDMARENHERLGGPTSCTRLVLGLTGAIASAQVAWWAVDLSLQFAETVDVILTPDAKRFVRPRMLRALGVNVWTDKRAWRETEKVPHMHLAHAADLVVVARPSARTLHKIAYGECSDLLGLTVTATEAPVILFPSMNTAMWNSPAVTRSVRQLRSDGVNVVEPAFGIELANRKRSYGAMGLGQFRPVALFEELRRLLVDVGRTTPVGPTAYGAR